MKSLEIVNVLIKCSEFITNDTIGVSKETVYQIKQDLEKLEKLEKAFEIFKRLINDKFAYVDLEYGVFDGTIDITEEEVELLEELMNYDR